MTATAPVVVMLTDDQLDEEISAVADEVCCPTYQAAAAAGCGCRGLAGQYLERLRAEATRREVAS